MPGEIDMSCKSFGLLCGLVSLVLVLVGLPALLVRLQTAQVICPCQDNADLFSASVTSDTMLQAVVLANPAPLHFDAVVLSSYKGMIEINASVSVVFMSDPCPVAASLVVGSRYVLAGTYFPKDGVLEISRCGNATRWEDVAASGQLTSFVNTYFNWATASCATGAPSLCGADPCASAKCAAPGAVCVPNLCLPCPASAQATFWRGAQRVCQ